MSSWTEGRRPISIAILAMGGEGGGVLADWIVAVGEQQGYYAQTTSVAGVAQRTGATVYYVEMYPGGDHEADARHTPILSLFPTPGEVDVVIASELMEAGRAIQRGFATPDRTTLIASTNRVYSMDEKLALGDGRVDSNTLLEAAHRGAKTFIGADFMALALSSGSVISASLFGALAGSGALPFARELYEDAIRAAGKGVEPSLAAFARGFDAARSPAPRPAPGAPSRPGPVPITIGKRPIDPAEEEAAAQEKRREEMAAANPASLVGPKLKHQAARIAAEFPPAARSMLLHGAVRTAVFQNVAYTDRYLDRVARLAAVDARRPAGSGARLSTEGARYVALWMCYQDTIQVAQQKIRRRRIAGVRAEAKAAPDQLLNVREYLHPQVEEIADTLPTKLGQWVENSPTFDKVVSRLTRDGMVVNTTGIVGFSMLRAMAAFRPMRPRSLRFGREQVAVDAWLDTVVRTAASDYELACEIVECARVLKGYGETHHHSVESFTKLMTAAAQLSGRPEAASTLVSLRQAALADESGAKLDEALAALTPLAEVAS